MKTWQKQRVATDTWRSLGCRTIPLEHWSKRKPTVEPRWPKQQTKKLRPQPTEINSFMSGTNWVWRPTHRRAIKERREIKIKGQRLEEVENFKYLGAIISNEGSKSEILSRIVQATAALSRLKIIWRDKNSSLASKVKLMRTLMLSTFIYACGSWTLTAEIERRIQALEMRCYGRLLNISYKDQMTNEEVRNRIQNATGVHDDLLTMVKKWKLRWYGHISRPSGMAKTILQGTVKRARKRGRQKKRWEDNIKEWTGMEFGDSLRAAEDREGWKGIVATSSEVKGLRWDGRWSYSGPVI